MCRGGWVRWTDGWMRIMRIKAADLTYGTNDWMGTQRRAEEKLQTCVSTGVAPGAGKDLMTYILAGRASKQAGPNKRMPEERPGREKSRKLVGDRRSRQMGMSAEAYERLGREKLIAGRRYADERWVSRCR